MKFPKIILIINSIISAIISTAITIMMVNAGFFGNHIFDEITKGMLSAEAETLIFFLIGFLISFLITNLMWLPYYLIKIFSMTKDTINKQYTDTKESVYTRDLPEYNAAVAGELVDLKATFEQEYLAGVMELIAKGYIIENDNQLIIDTSKSTDKLLKNEKYILETCTKLTTSLLVMGNYEFYKALKEDMYDLGFYKRSTFFKELKNKIEYSRQKDSKGTFITKCYILMYAMPLFIFILLQNFALMLILYLIILILIRKSKLTPKGELEKEKMSKLKLFLEKETDFKNKGEEERKLWGRYSAFAVAFGVNTEMNEEIRNKIVKKA